MTLTALKHAAHAACRSLIDERIRAIETGIAEAEASARSDTKSSAGDKYETGRAMAQQEVEKQQTALANLQRMRTILTHIDPMMRQRSVSEGALVRLDSGLFYIAVGLGRVMVDGSDIQVISPQAPLAQLLMNKEAGASATFNGRTHTVLEIA